MTRKIIVIRRSSWPDRGVVLGLIIVGALLVHHYGMGGLARIIWGVSHSVARGVISP
jgi:hypothetical protein